MSLSTFTFSVFRFVPDIVRDEGANLGVIAVDDASNLARSAFLPDMRRKVAALAPSANARVVSAAIDRFRRMASDHLQATIDFPKDGRIASTERLRALSGAMRNQFQLTPPRPVQAPSLEDAVQQLYVRYVAPPQRGIVEAPEVDRDLTLRELRDLVWRNIKDWGEPVKTWRAARAEDKYGGNGVQIILERTGEGKHAHHRADFWVRRRSPIAALVALPNGDDREIAYSRRDAIPTIVRDFRLVHPDFTAIAILPPRSAAGSPFTDETRRLLGDIEGVRIAHVDELDTLRSFVAPVLL